MTKSSKLVTDTIVDASAPAAPAATVKPPYAVRLIGPTTMILAQAAALIRSHGYVPDPNTAIEIFGPSGRIAMVLVQGQPEEYAVEAAAITIAEELDREKARYEADVQLAAERIVAANTKAAADAKRASLLAEQKAALAALEKQLASEAALEAVAANK